MENSASGGRGVRGKLLLFSQWLSVVYKLNFSPSCENRIMIMRQGKGLCFQSSSTQVLVPMTYGQIASESIRFFRLKFFSFTRREKRRVKLETWAKKPNALAGKGASNWHIIITGTQVFRNIALLMVPQSSEQTLPTWKWYFDVLMTRYSSLRVTLLDPWNRE